MASTIKQRLRRFNGTDYDYIYLSANMGDVVGTLGVSNGGTGATDAGGSIYNLVNLLDTLTEMTLANNDCLPIADISATTGKKITMAEISSFIVTYCTATIRVTSPAGTAVVVSYGGETVSTHTGTGSPVNVTSNHKGLWTITGTLSGETASVEVEVTGDGVYDATISFFTNPLNTDQLTIGMNTVYFTAYPDLKWCVDHLDGDYVYLGLYNARETIGFGANTTYSGSAIATKCDTYLNNTIPNVAQYLENVTVEGVTNKVFIPTYYQFSGTTGYGDQSGPVFSWPSASDANRAACVSNWLNINNTCWLSSPVNSYQVWTVHVDGSFGNIGPGDARGFRPEVKVRYKD